MDADEDKDRAHEVSDRTDEMIDAIRQRELKLAIADLKTTTALENEITALKQRVVDLENKNSKLTADCADLCFTIQVLRQQLQASSEKAAGAHDFHSKTMEKLIKTEARMADEQKDANRYRWLRDAAMDEVEDEDLKLVVGNLFADPATTDAAIDEEMNKGTTL